MQETQAPTEDCTGPTLPLRMEYGWDDWWKISVTSRPCRVLCTLGGGVALSTFAVSGALEAAGNRSGIFLFAALLLFVLALTRGLWLDFKLSWSWLGFMDDNRTMMIVHLSTSWVLALLVGWRYGVPILAEYDLVFAIPLGLIGLMLLMFAGVLFTLAIVGPSRVSITCAVGAVVLSAWIEGQWIPTRPEVWSLLFFDVLEFESSALLWGWTIFLAITGLIDRGGEDFFDLW